MNKEVKAKVQCETKSRFLKANQTRDQKVFRSFMRCSFDPFSRICRQEKKILSLKSHLFGTFSSRTFLLAPLGHTIEKIHSQIFSN